MNQEFESQRSQLLQANRWADQAQRDKINLYEELELWNRVSQESHARDCQKIEELTRICCEEADRARQAIIDELSVHQERTPSTASQLLAQIRDLQNKVISLSDAREIYDPESGSSSGATHVPSQPSAVLSPRTIPRCGSSGLPHDTRNITGTSGNVIERPPAQEGRSSTFFNNSKNPASSSQELRSDIAGNYNETREWNEKRTVEYVNAFTTLRWCEWLPEISNYGIASGKISWLYGNSKLESQLQDWSLYKNSRSSSHNALDQRSWDCNVSWRTYDIAIDCGARRFTWLRYSWCDDCVCIEKASQHACSLSQESKCRRAACSECQPILTRKTNCVHDLWVFPCNRSLWSSTRTLRLVHDKVTEWRRPRFSTLDRIKHFLVSEMPSDVILEGLYKSKLQDSVQLQTVLTLYDQETARNNGQTNYLRLKTAVKLHIDQMMRTRNFWVRNEVVERGSVTKSQSAKKAYVKRKLGECFQWKGTWTMFQRWLMQFQSWRKSLWQQWQRSETKRTIVFSCITFEGKTDWRRRTKILTGIRQ